MIRDRDVPETKEREKLVRGRPLTTAQKKVLLDEYFKDYKKDAK